MCVCVYVWCDPLCGIPAASIHQMPTTNAVIIVVVIRLDSAENDEDTFLQTDIVSSWAGALDRKCETFGIFYDNLKNGFQYS